MEIKNRVTKLLKSMNEGAYEREEVISLALLTAIAGESIFLLGLPGVGKSMIARRLKLAFKNATSFEYLMSRFSTPDEIFGPVSISKLKDEDTYERAVKGYLPTADIVFLDEIWKAGPAIQNSLLTALNERLFRNGDHDIRLPLKAVISASNELPAEGEGLEALWDRFLVRYIVEPINDKYAFLKMLTEKEVVCTVDSALQFSESELQTVWSKIDNIWIPEVICDIICHIRKILKNQQNDALREIEEVPYVSDRRWRKIVKVLRTSAWLNGRDMIDVSDCLLLEYMIWDKDDQIDGVKAIVADAIASQIASVELSDLLTRERIKSMVFTHQISDNSPLRTGDTRGVIIEMNTELEKVITAIKYLVHDNIFLKSFDNYSHLINSLEKLRITKSHFRSNR